MKSVLCIIFNKIIKEFNSDYIFLWNEQDIVFNENKEEDDGYWEDE
jgi:hypothetical protein